jgi:hypothetical protein
MALCDVDEKGGGCGRIEELRGEGEKRNVGMEIIRLDPP